MNRSCILALLTAAMAAGLSAQTTTLRFSGEVNYRGGNLASFFTVGDTFTFDVTFDASTSAVSTFDSFDYLGTSAQLLIDASGGAFQVDVTAPYFQIRNDYSGYDEYIVNFSYPPTTSFDVVGGFSGTLSSGPVLRLFDGTAAALGSNDLPTSLDRAAWSSSASSSYLGLYFDPGTGADFLRLGIGNISTLSAVPEPGTYAVVAGLLGLAYAAYRRRRVRSGNG